MSFRMALVTWWTFRIFSIFFCSGRGKGESEAPGGGLVDFYIENPRRGGGCGRAKQVPFVKLAF